MKTLSRRTMLRGLTSGAAVALGLPLLDAMLTPRAWASGEGLPKRFGLFFWGNGNLPDRWTPEDVGRAYRMSDQLAPLSALKDKITVVTGTSVKLPNLVPHGSGAAGILSAAPLRSSAGDDFSAPTIDQVIAREVGGATLFRSLQTAATNTLGLSFSGPSARNPAETDPHGLYARLFGPTFIEPGSGGLVDPRLGLRRSVLDAVMGDLHSIEARVGAADRARLDQHLTGLRELEGRLARLEEDPPSLDACSRPGALTDDFSDIDGRPQVLRRNQVMAELLAMALACDQTRVIAHFLSEPVHDLLFPGASAGHHDLTHNEPTPQPEVHAITLTCVTAFADFLSAMDAIPEGEETVLDHMVVLGTTEISLGRTHSLDEMPIVLGGSAHGALVTGEHVRSVGRESSTKVLMTLLRAMDVVMPRFGVGEAEVSEGLPGLET